MNRTLILLVIVPALALAAAGCQPAQAEAVQPAVSSTPRAASTQAPSALPSEAVPATPAEAAPATPGQAAATIVEFSLETRAADGKLLFVGVGGDIDGVVNPDLVVPPGATVNLTLINGDGIPHDLTVPDFNAKTALVSRKGKSTQISFTVDRAGAYVYYCTVTGHREMGQEGQLIATAAGN
jgi:nitrite reductase (NO-forming)